MNCGKARSLFSLVYDQEAGAATAQFEAHLEGCGDCRESWMEYQADLRGVGTALASMAQVAESWPERPLRLDSVPQRRRLPFGALAWAWGAVAVAFVAVVLLYLGDAPVTQPGSPPPAAAVARDAGVESVDDNGAPELDPSMLMRAEFLDRSSLPVVAPPALDQRYRLMGQELLGGGTCPEEVRLAYGCQDARLHIEVLAAGQKPQPCRGSLVKLHDCVGCLEHGCGVNGFELRWTNRGRQFRVSGEHLSPEEALRLARDIDWRYQTSLADLQWYDLAGTQR